MINCNFKGKFFLGLLALVLGLVLTSGVDPLWAGGKPGALVDPMKITTATATFDPVRPEAARVIATAFQSLGWDVTSDPIDYNQNVQKVVLEHDYDMWLVMLSGASLRIDPNVFIYKINYSGEYKKGGYNWAGLNDPEVDRLAVEQQKTMDQEKRREQVFQAQARLHDLQSMTVLAYAQMTNAYRSDRIKNVVPMMGEGIGSFWTDINMEVIKGDGYVRTGATAPPQKSEPGIGQGPPGVFGTAHDLRPSLPHRPGRSGQTLGGRILYPRGSDHHRPGAQKRHEIPRRSGSHGRGRQIQL